MLRSQMLRHRLLRRPPLQLVRRPALSGVRSGAYAARSGVRSDAKVAGSDVWRGAKAARSDVRYGVQVVRRRNKSHYSAATEETLTARGRFSLLAGRAFSRRAVLADGDASISIIGAPATGQSASPSPTRRRRRCLLASISTRWK